ncbi:MAG: hypothetical protein RBT40_09515, partial [Petrimonas sp.]|nr:hypothetical protein [Petrimonas sp.]
IITRLAGKCFFLHLSCFYLLLNFVRQGVLKYKNGGVTDRDSAIQIKTGAFKQAPVFLIRV